MFVVRWISASCASDGISNLELLPKQIQDNNIHPQNLQHTYHYEFPKYLLIGYMDP